MATYEEVEGTTPQDRRRYRQIQSLLQKYDNEDAEEDARATMKQRLDKLARFMRIAGDVAQLLVRMRDKPRWYDWAALGTSAVNVAVQLQQEVAASREVAGVMPYFSDEKGWSRITSWQMTKLIYPLVRDGRLVREASGGSPDNSYIGKIGDVSVGWSMHTKQTTGTDSDLKPSVMWYKTDEWDTLLEAVAARFWEEFGCDHVAFSNRGLSDDDAAEEGLVETAFMAALAERMTQFLSKGCTRGYLIEGPPGTGKTTAIQHLVRKMKLRSLRIDLNAFAAGENTVYYSEIVGDVNLMVRILQPDVVIIDDIDRIDADDQAQLLRTLEVMHANCKIILTTVNERRRLLRPLLRPGRLDDHIMTLGIEPEVLRLLLDEDDYDLIDLMRTWPIAYVVDYIERRRVLGRNAAREEVDDLDERVKYIGGIVEEDED